MQFYERTLATYNKYTADPKKKNYSNIALTLGLLIILVAMIYPAIQHITEVNKEISDGKVFEKGLITKIEALDSAKNNLAAIKTDLPLLEKALPTGSDMKTYISKPLEIVAGRHKLQINTVQFSDVPISDPKKDDPTNVRNIDFSISLTGGFVDFVGFLKDIENYIRVTKITNLNAKGSAGALLFTLQATTNYLGIPVSVVPNQVPTEGGQ